MIIITNDIAESCEHKAKVLIQTDDLVESSSIKILVGKVN
jgi:hypothetical protein